MKKNSLKWLLTAILSCGILSAASAASASANTITATSEEKYGKALADLIKEQEAKGENRILSADPYCEGRLIIQAEKRISLEAISAETVIEGPDHLYIAQFSGPAAAQKAHKKIAKLSGVRYVEPDIPVYQMDVDPSTLGNGYTMDDAELKKNLYGDAANEMIQNEAALLDGEEEENGSDSDSTLRWALPMLRTKQFAANVKATTSGSIKVAVVDSGVDYYHSHLKNRIIKGYDYIDGDSDPYDQNGHGTHVAGTVVDCTPGLKVKILAVRVTGAEGKGSCSQAGQGIRYAANHGAKVINISMGAQSHSYYYDSAVEYAVKKGAVVVAASGNGDGTYGYNLNYKDCCPAHMAEPIVVGAINQYQQIGSFSNYGKTVDVAAPGVMIYSCALGGGYKYDNGTSMATPHVTGIVAMYRLKYPGKSVSYYEKLARKTTLDLGASGRDDYYGYGMIRCPIVKKAAVTYAKKIKLNKTSVTSYVGSTVKLKVSYTPSAVKKKTITWTSSNKKIATVSSGTVKCKKTGTVTITAKAPGGAKATCKIRVKKKSTTVSRNISIPFTDFTSSYQEADSRAKTVSAGKTVIQGTKGFVKFVPTKTKTWTFTFTGLAPAVSSASDVFVAYAYILGQHSSSTITFKPVATQGGSSTAIWFGTKAYYTRIVEGTVVNTGSCLYKRTAKVRLTKGEPVYLYMNISGLNSAKSKISLTIS